MNQLSYQILRSVFTRGTRPSLTTCVHMSTNDAEKASTSVSTNDEAKREKAFHHNPKYDALTPGIVSRKLTMGQKRYMMLAWKHKSIKDMPDILTVTQIDKLYSRARITVNLMMGVVVLVCCMGAVYNGKRMAAGGDSLEKRGIALQKRLREEHLAKLKKEE